MVDNILSTYLFMIIDQILIISYFGVYTDLLLLVIQETLEVEITGTRVVVEEEEVAIGIKEVAEGVVVETGTRVAAEVATGTRVAEAEVATGTKVVAEVVITMAMVVSLINST